MNGFKKHISSCKSLLRLKQCKSFQLHFWQWPLYCYLTLKGHNFTFAVIQFWNWCHLNASWVHFPLGSVTQNDQTDTLLPFFFLLSSINSTPQVLQKHIHSFWQKVRKCTRSSSCFFPPIAQTTNNNREWPRQFDRVTKKERVFEDVSLVELMYPVFIACQVELSYAARVYVVCLFNVFNVWR